MKMAVIWIVCEPELSSVQRASLSFIEKPASDAEEQTSTVTISVATAVLVDTKVGDKDGAIVTVSVGGGKEVDLGVALLGEVAVSVADGAIVIVDVLVGGSVAVSNSAGADVVLVAVSTAFSAT